MSLIDTDRHPVECPFCGMEQDVDLEVLIEQQVNKSTATFACHDCERTFSVTVTITYNIDTKRVC